MRNKWSAQQKRKTEKESVAGGCKRTRWQRLCGTTRDRRSVKMNSAPAPFLSLSLSLSLFSVAAIPRLLIFLIFPPSFSCAPIAVYFSISVSRLFLHFCLFFIWLQCFICLSKARKKCPSAQYRLTEAAKITKTFFSFHISSPFFLFSPSTFVFVRFLFWLSLWLPEKGK